MDNNELDKIIKEKLKNQIISSKEVEEKVKNTIKQQKELNKKASNSKKYRALKLIVSIAAVALIAFMLGISFNGNGLNFEEKIITVATIKDIKPTKSQNEVLASDSEFIIYAEGENLTVESVQKALYIEPALEYSIKKTSKDNEYKLTFNQNIPNNTIIKLQYVKDKITEDSWAYQTSTELSVNGTYPYNGSTTVSKNSVIEIEFSYANVEDLESNIEITPATNGTWEHLGKVWRFTPQIQLQEGKYYVKIKSGIVAGQKTLKNDYTFSFEVGEWKATEYIYNSIAIDGINTYKPDEAVRIYCSASNLLQKLVISKIEIARFDNKDKFISYVQNEDYQQATDIKEYEFDQTQYYLQLKEGLQTGYYAAIVYGANNIEMFNCPIQINDLSAYAIETERDVLVWVANGENLAQDVQVKYQGKLQKTNNQGLAEFKGIADDSEEIKYLGIGNTSNELVIGIYNYDLDNYPYAYLYTDRPLYKNTDTINIWGFVPINQFYDEVQEEFYIELNSEGKQKVKVEKDGNLNYAIELKNHMDNYSVIRLYYKDKMIAARNIEIKNYEAQNYTYEINYDKNYAVAGTTFEFNVKINHITGLTVPNKTIRAKYDGKTYKATSGEDGIAHFSIDIPVKEHESSYANRNQITIYNGDTEEYTGKEEYIDMYEIHKDVYTKTQRTTDTCKATIYKLATDRNITVEYNLSSLYNGTYDTTVNIKLEENTYTRYISGYTYNEYTKEREPRYSYSSTKNVQDIKTIQTQNGIAEIKINELNLKQDSEEQNYSYNLIFEYKDQSGRTVKVNEFIPVENEAITQEVGYYHEAMYSSDLLHSAATKGISSTYYTYRYFLNCEENTFSIGDTVNFALTESTSGGNKEIKNDGKILRIVLQEDITKKEIIENDNFNYTFDENDFPGCKMTSAYFYNGKFYRMPIYYFDFNAKDRKVDVEITADKEQYHPGDDVILTIKTTNNGKPVKSFVNISVANKAVLELQEDSINLLETIYANRNYAVYTYSTFRDYLNYGGGGGGGGGDELRSKFGDTACFETVYTDSKGTATITFKLPDNVTTYRVTAHSANKDLYLGVNTIDIVSTLDFFVQFTEPRNVKTTDDLVLNATSVAEEKYDVEYEFTIKELNQTLTTTAGTNTLATVNFGKIPYGTYTAVIKGKHGDMQDAVEYKFDIVESAQEVKTKTSVDITNGVTITPTKNPITLEIYNRNMNQYLQYVDFIEGTVNQRLDTQIAYNEIQKIKHKYYNTRTSGSNIAMSQYNESSYLKNLPNAKPDIVLSALVSYYTDGYYEKNSQLFSEIDNLFESYLLAAANNEPVLIDLIHLKEEQNISNYNKLLVTLSLEFLGDFPNARELYSTITLTPEEASEYKSIVAIIETFINKESAVIKINELIESNPADEYLRFSILSFFENKSVDIEKESEVKVKAKNLNETIKINGMQIKTLTINNVDLSTIKFETSSEDLIVSYYYQTLLDNIDAQNISKDMRISINGELKKGNTVTLVVELPKEYEGQVRIALPNSLRLAQNYIYSTKQKYYLQNNQIDYATFFKQKECTKMEIPLLVTYEGNYKFENIVCNVDGIYHISNSLDLNINK